MIPDAWLPSKLGDVTTWRSGGTPPMSNKSFWNGDIPWISASTMYSNAFETSTKFISVEGLKAGSKLACPNDLLLLVRGSMLWNRIPIGIAKRSLAFNQDVKSITANSGLSPNFLLFWFLANENKLLHMVTGTGIGAGKFDTKELQSLNIVIPPLPEQKKIAQILSTWDKAIETVEKLIENSSQKKKALMQQLLTGKKRFPEFDGEWKEVRLADVLKEKKRKGKMVPTNEGKLGLPYIGSTSFDGDFGIYTDSSDAILCASDDILVLWDGENAGKAATGLMGVVSSTVVRYCIDEFKADSRFITYNLLQDNYKVRAIREGSGIPHMPGDFEQWYRIALPSLNEQQKIASVLSSADQEIQTWQQELTHLKQEKKALMQQLLTGKRRVKV